MRQLRSIGTFLIVGAIICGLIGYEVYASKKATAKEVASQLDLELVSFEVPFESKVACLLAVFLTVAGLRCLFSSKSNSKNSQAQTDGQPGTLLTANQSLADQSKQPSDLL